MKLIQILSGKIPHEEGEHALHLEHVGLWSILAGGVSLAFFSSLLTVYSFGWANVVWYGYAIFHFALGPFYLYIKSKSGHKHALKQSLLIMLLMALIVPFVEAMLIGSFVWSNYAAYAAVVPLAALAFDSKHVLRWSCWSVAMLVLGILIEPHLVLNPRLPHWFMLTWFLGSTLGPMGTAICILSYIAIQRERTMDRLRLEKKKTEDLLLNVMPQKVVQMFMQKEDWESKMAEHFEDATILFADVVDFTPLSKNMSPGELVGVLNEVFSKFDKLVERHGLEKIKTIGDCYMVAAGVPLSRADHAIVQAQLAVDIRDWVMQNRFRGHQLSFRIGLSSGSVVAGVIGHDKFIYDLWGEAVNTASHIKALGTPNEIQITRSTYELIRDDFECEPCGLVMVKGKGEIEIWHVRKRKSMPMIAHALMA